ncbi:MAG: response regulator [Bacteroidota bacterium]
MENKQTGILHVEDDAVDAMVMERALKKLELNYILYQATNGIEALDVLRGTNGKEKIQPTPKIILLDLNMPKMNGIEFLRELRADKNLKSLSVFIMTTSSDERDRADAYELNVAGYLIKPISLDNYNHIVATLSAFWKLNEFGNP